MTLITQKYTAEKLGISRTTLWRMYNDPDLNFPRKVKITDHNIRFVDEEIDNWIKNRKDKIRA